MKASMERVRLALAALALFAAAAAAEELEPVEMDEVDEPEEIVVTATRTERALDDAPGAVTVIGRDEIHWKGGTDIGDVIDGAEGVDVLSYGGPGSRSTAHLRGTYGVHTLVLVDGRTQNSPSRGSADLSGISPAFIERIEVVRGPTSSLYGTGAVGGVVQVFTREVPGERMNELNLSSGSFDTYSASHLSGMPAGWGGAVVGVYGFRTDGHRPNSEAETVELFGRFRIGDVEGDAGRLNLSMGLKDSRAGWPGPKPAGGGEVTSLDDFGESTRGYLQAEYLLVGLRARAAVKRWRDEAVNWGTTVRETTTPELEVSSTWEPREGLRTVAGGQLSLDRHRVVSAPGRLHERTTGAVWGQIEAERGPWQSVAGLRWDGPSDFDGRASGRVLGAWRSDSGLRIEAGVGTAFRAPTLDDLHQPFDPMMMAEGNPDLEPESSLEADLTVKLSPAGGEGARLTASLFTKRVDDLIAWRPDAANIWRPENLDGVAIQGAELAGSVSLAAGLRGGLSYAHLRARETGPRLYYMGDKADPSTYLYEETTRDLANTPDHKLSLSIEALKETASGTVEVHLTASWVSDIRQYYKSEEEVLDPEYFVSYPEKTLDARWLVALGVSWSWSGGEAFVRMDNLLDEEYSTQFGYAIDDGDYPMPGRSVTVGARLSF